MRLSEFVDEVSRSISIDSDVPDSPAIVYLANLGKQVARSLAAGNLAHRQALFDAVEAALLDGDDRLKDAIATGFLEAAFMEAERSSPEAVELIWSNLGPLAASYLRAWVQFTEGETDQQP